MIVTDDPEKRRNASMKPIGPVNALYPMPTTLVGATVNGKPNFLTVGGYRGKESMP